MDEIEDTFSQPSKNPEVLKSFGYRLNNQFSVNESYRRAKELEWLESLRQYRGLYDPDVAIDLEASKVYPKITRSKVNIVLSRLHEMLFPETDKNWELLPTPDPRINKEIVKQIAMGLVKPAVIDPATGQPAIDPKTGKPSLPQPPTVLELKLAIADFAKRTCENMSTQIDDQFTEMDYSGETKKVLRSGLMYGTGIMKGPLVKKRTRRIWEPESATGDYAEKSSDEDVPDLQAVRIWDWYPDMSVTEIEHMDGSFERHIFTKHDLRALIKRPDFYGDVIQTYLTEHKDGDYVPKTWEVDLQVIEVEAGSGKGTAKPSSTSATDTGQPQGTSRQTGKRYEALEYWGYVDGHDLEACGLNIEDVALEYEANVWLLGGIVIKAVLMDKAIDEYKVFYYEKDETSIFGEGLARIMRHSQLAVAAAARMVLDNGAVCAGPQVEVNWSLMTEGQDLNSFYARKIWYRQGRGVEAQYPAIRAVQIDSHITELLAIIKAFKDFGDEETTLPTWWMNAQDTNNETTQVTSGRLGTIGVSIKDVVKNFDAFTEKILRDMYAWNMEFNERQDIKGDYLAKARGVSSLVMKEVRMAALNQRFSIMQPEDWVYYDRREFNREIDKAHDLNLALKTQEEVDKITAKQKEDIAKGQAIALLDAQADVDKKKAQAAQFLAKAKGHNIAAEKDAITPPEQPETIDPRVTDAEVAAKETEAAGKDIDNASKVAVIQQAAEKHLLDLQHQDEKHQAGMSMDIAKGAQDMSVKEKMSDHKMEMDEVRASQPKGEEKPQGKRPKQLRKKGG